MTLIQNALYFPTHDYYMPSTHVHDYQVFEYLPGHKASTDGGLHYLHRTVTPPEHSHLVVDWSLTDESSEDEIRAKLLWGSLPLDKTKPRVHVYRPIAALTLDHLRAIKANVPRINPLHAQVIDYWIEVNENRANGA